MVLSARSSAARLQRFQVLPGGLAPQPDQPQRAAPVGRALSVAAVSGRFVELSGVGGAPVLSLALALVAEAQLDNENVVWIGARDGTFFAPDADRLGIDLTALPIIACHTQPDPVLAAGRAASHLMRSGAFGLVVLDLPGDAELPLPLQSRLTGLAQKYGIALLALTEKPADQPSLGSLVSLHGQVRCGPITRGVADVTVDVIKDKRHGPGWSHLERFRAPAGLA